MCTSRISARSDAYARSDERSSCIACSRFVILVVVVVIVVSLCCGSYEATDDAGVDIVEAAPDVSVDSSNAPKLLDATESIVELDESLSLFVSSSIYLSLSPSGYPTGDIESCGFPLTPSFSLDSLDCGTVNGEREFSDSSGGSAEGFTRNGGVTSSSFSSIPNSSRT